MGFQNIFLHIIPHGGGHTPYELMYGKQVYLLFPFEIKTLRSTFYVGMEISKDQKHHLEPHSEFE